VLDIGTGNPRDGEAAAYNPNDRVPDVVKADRNRASHDILEPGSAIKSFFVADGAGLRQLSRKQASRHLARLHEGAEPGYSRTSTVFGTRGSETILRQSSNVGMGLLALSLEPEKMWQTLKTLGFGQVTQAVPGESAGTE